MIVYSSIWNGSFLNERVIFMIYVECKPDVLLIKTLGVPVNKYKHSGDKGRVCRDLEHNKYSTGLVDEDAAGTQPSYMSKMKIKGNKDDIKYLVEPDGTNSMVVLCPKHEDWILKAAKEVGINMREFKLPNDPDELHKEINLCLDKYEVFLKAIKDKSRRITLLRDILAGDVGGIIND